MGKWLKLCKEKSTDSVDSVKESLPLENVKKESAPSKEQAKVKVVSEVIDPSKDTSVEGISHAEIERGYTLFGHLTDTEKEAYAGWYEVMTNEKFNLSSEEAHKKTAEFIAKTSKMLQRENCIRQFKMQGYFNIFFPTLNKTIYVVKNKKIREIIKAPPGDIYLASEIQKLKGLEGEELMLMLEVKEIFKGI